MYLLDEIHMNLGDGRSQGRVGFIEFINTDMQSAWFGLCRRTYSIQAPQASRRFTSLNTAGIYRTELDSNRSHAASLRRR